LEYADSYLVDVKFGAVIDVNPTGAGWYNAYEDRDVVALYSLDNNNSSVNPAITNNGAVRNWTDNHHGIIGYLDDENVAKVIRSGF